MGLQSMKRLTKVFSCLSGDWRDPCYPNWKRALEKEVKRLKRTKKGRGEADAEQRRKEIKEVEVNKSEQKVKKQKEVDGG